MRLCTLAVSLILGAAALAAQGTAPATLPVTRTPAAVAQPRPAPDVGALAPDFALSGTDGRIHTLAEHRGLRPVVIAWFPKAFAKY